MSGSPPPGADADRLGRYLLLAKVGEGGMGVVHLAQAPSGEQVALKVLRPHVVGDDDGRARLAREVTSLRRVKSRRVAEVYDADPWGARPFVVTRYVDGPALHDRVRSGGPLTGADLHAVALGLAEALVAVHAVGVLHRDVKPSNVLIEGRDPVLIDFGLAKLAEDSKLTATGWLMGTPGYLAPEVLYGDDPAPAADVHAWAATVVFAATGTTPFGGGPGMAVMDRARRGEHDLSATPRGLRPLLTRCLSPMPQDRPSAAEVVAHLAGRPPGVPPPAAGPAPHTRTLPATADRPQHPPPRPERQAPQQPAPVVPPEQPASARSSGLLRRLLMLGLFALFVFGVAAAPYAAVAVTFALTWLLRTASRNRDARTDRREQRGERRSDSLVSALVSPWHALLTLPGTLVLLLSVTVTIAIVAAPLWLLGLQSWHSLLAGGAVGASVLWWGPGSYRLRRQTRRSLRRTTTSPRAGWGWCAGLLVGVLLLSSVQPTGGVVWWPDDGRPVTRPELPSVLQP